MNYLQAEAEIRAFFDAAWGNMTPVAWPDTNFDIPEGKTWVRFDCRENNGEQISIGAPGANTFRQYGIVTIQIFQPLGKASIDARTKAQAAIAAFKGKVSANGVHFQNVFGRPIGNDGAGFYQINALVSYYYDDIT